MRNIPSKPFSSGTEYEIFKYNYCERCRKHKVREDDGFPEFPENGGCRIEDAMENARFNISLFPNKKIRQIEDENGKTIKFHSCIEFDEVEGVE